MSLIHWWPLNGNLNDYGTKNVALTNNGTTINNNGKIGKTYEFDGSSSYLETNLSSEVFAGTNHPFSIAFWLKFTDDISSRKIIFGNYGLSNSFFNIEMSYGSSAYNGRLRFDWLSSIDHWFPATGVQNVWQHYVVTFDGINKISMYFNGSFIESFTGTLASVTGTRFFLGRDSRTGGTALKGFLNDFRIYNHALSQKEVKELAKGLVLHYNFEDAYAEGTTNLISTITSSNAKLPLVGNGVDVQTAAGDAYCSLKLSSALVNGTTYTLSFDVSNLKSGESCSFGFYDSGMHNTTYIHNGRTVITFTAWNNASSLTFDDGGRNNTTVISLRNFQIEQKDHATPYVNGTRQPGLIYDSSGYGYNGTINGDLQIVNDSACGQYSANIINSYIKVPTINYPELTILFWFKRNALTSTRQFIFTGWPGISIELTASNGWRVYYTKNSSSATIGIPISVTLQANVWYHIAIVIGSSGNKSFVNGVQTGTSTYEAPYYNSTDFRIGSYGSYVNFNAKLSDFKIYATALSASDILAEYQRKAAIDRNGNLYSGQFIEQNGTTKIATKKDQVITNNFVEGTDKVKVFDKYIELEYIESTGTQYIDSGFAPSNKTIWILDAQFTQIVSNTYQINGRYDSGVSPSGQRFDIGIAANGKYWLGCGGSSDNTKTADTNRHIFTINTENGKATIDNSSYTLSNQTMVSTKTFCLFARRANATIEYWCKEKIYSCQIYDNKVLTRHFIPAKRKSDNVIGLFDLVNQKFYTNAGTGTFTAGPEKGELSIICTNELNEL